MKISRNTLTELYNKFYNIPLELQTNEVLFSGQTAVYSKKGKASILALDEYNRAQKDILSSSMQLVLEKKIHQHKLPVVNGVECLIVAMVNPDDGNYDVQDLDPAQEDRYCSVDCEADINAWLAYAKSINLNRIVRDYLADNPDHLYIKPKDGMWVTPRGWKALALQVDVFDELEPEYHFPIISGIIGTVEGARFEAYMREYSKVITIEDIAKIAEPAWKSTGKDIMKTGDIVKEFLDQSEVENIMLVEKVHQLMDKYLPKTMKEINPDKSMVLFATLYALDLEVLAGVLHHYKAISDKDKENIVYEILAQSDAKYHASGRKELFRKIASHIKR